MKILYIIPTLGPGGAEKLLIDLVRGMSEKKVEVEVLVLSNKDGFYKDDIENLNVPVYYGNSRRPYSFFHIKTIYKLLNKKYDIIHTHLYPAQLLLFIATLFKKKRNIYITTEHSTQNRRRGNRLLALLDRLIYSQYNKIIAITEGVKKSLVKELTINCEKVQVINNGINLKQYRNASIIRRDALISNYEKDDFLILMVAGFRKMKDFQTVIRAAALLPNNYKFIFVGDGPQREVVEDYATKKGVENVFFLGARKDVPNIMKSVDLFVLSSHWEGFGLVVVEAMASGLPVIGTNVEGMGDIIRDTGILFEVESERELKNWIKTISENRLLRDSLVNKSIEKSEYFSIEGMIEHYLKIYKCLDIK